MLTKDTEDILVVGTIMELMELVHIMLVDTVEPTVDIMRIMVKTSKLKLMEYTTSEATVVFIANTVVLVVVTVVHMVLTVVMEKDVSVDDTEDAKDPTAVIMVDITEDTDSKMDGLHTHVTPHVVDTTLHVESDVAELVELVEELVLATRNTL